MALNRVRDAVNFTLKPLQGLLQRSPVYVQIAGGQLGQGQHLLQGALDFEWIGWIFQTFLWAAWAYAP